MKMMRTITILKMSVLSLSLAIGVSHLAHAEKNVFSTSSTDQKQWVGQTAPDFRLQDQNGKWHQLKDFQGKWLVLYFYPKDDSPGCTQEANRFKALAPQFTQSNAVVMGVSLDDVASHKKFSEKLGLPFLILADSDHQLAEKFGIVRNLGLIKIAKRESFLIDPKGMVVYHYSSVDTQTHADEVLKDVKRLQQKK
ncbi:MULTISPECIES: peroxiredoxin [unclassified Acinetobacter]|uniref:peroxiredoxin n=1 Tax=unclassified Acinetobacter TaxID=196816 RepID=UPI00190E479E|nr:MULTISPECIES: peroxiredoxin [unclassified Acinetobacter]MBK0064910.1 peroxiredoxin [Acinetobacter sp. S55]MBK0068267.1 peroxiredoxin [Acinetobacter sp. S54]